MKGNINQSARRYYLSQVDYARAALLRGPIEQRGRTFWFGRRRFGGRAIKQLLASGEAVMIGDEIRRTL